MPSAVLDLDELLGSGEAGRRLKLSSEWVRQLAEAGQLRGMRTRLGWLFSVEDLDRFAATRRNKDND